LERPFISAHIAAAEDSGITPPPPGVLEGKDAADYGIPNSLPVAA